MTSEIQIIDLLNKYICFTQSDLAQYVFIASQKHKKMANIVQKISKEGVGDDSRLKELRLSASELDDYLDTEFKRVFEKNYTFLEDYFSNRSDKTIRASIKVIIEDNIVSLRRYPDCEYEDFESKVSENSAFDALAKGQDYYLCNDIPEEIAKGLYKNNRINIQLAFDYYQRLKAGELSKENKIQLDEEWQKCWKKVKSITTLEENVPIVDSCYRSTLVLPLSLETEKLDASFKEYFHMGSQLHFQPGKLIFGFLCLDHPEEGFFKEEKDVKMGYIFCDILSLYLIPQLAYTQYSETYFDAVSGLEHI
jgi:hypothetical protein